MGRYDFRPLRVLEHAQRLVSCERIRTRPAWYSALGHVPPQEPLVRTQPLQHREAGLSNKRRKLSKRRPSRMFAPQNITYEEDRLRETFFRDHPWELARPRLLLEDDGRDAHRRQGSSVRQFDGLSGEGVIQRQLELQQCGQDTSSAYDQARREFYHERLQEDTERRVAREEALYMGAEFGPSVGQIGMQLEDQEYERWRAWATNEVALQAQRQASMYSGSETGDVTTASKAETSAAAQEVADVLPAQGQSANGGDMFRPSPT